jgi:type VI secretion system secreted protein VgrG
MVTLTQENRLLSLSTPLGEDMLLLTGFTGEEAMSRLFAFHLDLLSEDEAIAPKAIIGKNVTWRVEFVGGEQRSFNGFVSRFAASSTQMRKLRA